MPARPLRPEPVPARLNLAQYCLGVGPGSPRDPGARALVVVHDHLHPTVGAKTWTFGELDTAVRRCAQGLSDVGIRAGDRVLLRLENTAEFPFAWFGAMAAGIVAVPTSAQLTAPEAGWIARDSGAVAIVGDLPADSPLPRVPAATLREWVAGGEQAAYRNTDPEDPAFLVYTSGTSARPKGVLHAHRSVWGRRPMYAGWHDLRAGDVVLHAGALNWTYTLGVGLTDPWAVGATAIVAGERNPSVWQRIIEDFGVTIFAAVPGVYRQWLRAGPNPDALVTLRHALSAGEALDARLYRAWVRATGVELYEALGMSEVSTFVSSGPAVPVVPGSPGRPQPGRRVAVLPVDGGEQPCAPGEVGLLAVHRGDPGLMLGYWQRPDEDVAGRRGAWFVTNDLVSVDGGGYVHHHGRSDDVMTALGYRVSPREVEEALARHPAVAEIAVTEVPVRPGVCIIAAFVVPAVPGRSGEPETAALLDFARSHLAAYKCPKEIVWVDALPRTANGKLLRRAIHGRTRASGGSVPGAPR